MVLPALMAKDRLPALIPLVLPPEERKTHPVPLPPWRRERADVTFTMSLIGQLRSIDDAESLLKVLDRLFDSKPRLSSAPGKKRRRRN